MIPRALNLSNPEDGGDTDSSQWIETRQVRPSSFSQQSVRFLLPTSGVMLADGFVQLQVITTNANGTPNNDMFQPISTGIFSCIDSATFSIGGVQIAQTRGLGHRFTMTNKFRSQRERAQLQQVRSGVCDTMMVGEMVADGGTFFAGGVWEPDIQTGAIDPEGINGGESKVDRRISGSYKFNGTAQSPIFRVYIADLFPGLTYFNLPLELLPRGQIVINFTPDIGNGYRALGDKSAASGNPLWIAGSRIQENTAILHCSLAHWDDPVNTVSTMEKLAIEFEKGLKLTFTDDSYQRVNKPQVAANEADDFNTLLRLDNETVRSILVATPRAPSASDLGNNRLLGLYFSEKSKVSSSFQLSINSAQVFPSPLDTPALQYSEFSQCFAAPCSINSALWSYLGQTSDATSGVTDPNRSRVTNKDYQSWVFNDEIVGRFGYYGANLSTTYANVNGAGTKIAPHVPVVVSISEKGGTNVASGAVPQKLVHIWCVCERVMAIQNGKVVVTGA